MMIAKRIAQKLTGKYHYDSDPTRDVNYVTVACGATHQPKPEYRTNDWNKVTCKRCLQHKKAVRKGQHSQGGMPDVMPITQVPKPPLPTDLRGMANMMTELRSQMSQPNYPDDVDDQFEILSDRFWPAVRKAVLQWMASKGFRKNASAYAAEMSDSDVNDPNGILDLLVDDAAMTANYYEFLDASG